MAAPSVVNSVAIPWQAAYPLNCSGAFDSTGCDTIIVVFHCMTGESSDAVCTYGGQTGTLVGRAWKSTASSAGTVWAWAITGFTPGAGTITVSQEYTYANTGAAYVVGLSGGNGIGAFDVDLSDTPAVSSSVVATGDNSTFIAFTGCGQAPALTANTISPAGTLLANWSDPIGGTPAEIGKIFSVAGVSLGGTCSATANATYNYTATVVVEVLGVSGGPSITSGPLTGFSFGIGSGTVILPPTISAGPLSGLAFALGTGSVVLPPVIAAGPLSFSLVQKTGTITFPPLIVSGPLSFSVGIQTGNITFPPLVVANPLSLSLGMPTPAVTNPNDVVVGPLALNLGMGTGTVLVPPVIVAGPLAINALLTSPSISVTAAPPQVTAAPLSLSFFLGSVSVSSMAITLPKTVAPGEHVTVTVRFAPSAEGTRNGSLSIVSNEAGSPRSVSLTGSGGAAAMSRVTISGNQFMTGSTPIRLKSMNYTGGEGTNYAPHALWKVAWRHTLDQIKGFGFNCLRFQLSGDFCKNPAIPGAAIDGAINPDVVGKTSLQFLDMIVDYCATIGLYIVLDHHRCFASGGNGTDGWPGAGGNTGSYSQTDWINDWLVLANRYKDKTNIVGADVHNEPYQIEWSYWAPMVEACGNAIHAVAPNWIIFVEGDTSWTGQGHYPEATLNSDSIWWGAQLIGAQPGNRPISLTLPNKVAYAPHEYGLSVAGQSWLADNGKAVTNWPKNLLPIWRQHWGWAVEQNIAPIWIGEVGGKFGYDNATGAYNPTASTPYEVEWLNQLISYMNGDWNGDGTNHLTGGKVGMSFAYWTDMLSGDTGSIFIDNDLTTPQTGKLALIANLLT